MNPSSTCSGRTDTDVIIPSVIITQSACNQNIGLPTFEQDSCSTRTWHYSEPVDPQNINLIKIMTQRCHELEARLQLAQKDCLFNESKVSTFKKQVELRDTEINCLWQLIEDKQQPSELSISGNDCPDSNLPSGRPNSKSRVFQTTDGDSGPRRSAPKYGSNGTRERASQCSLLAAVGDTVVARGEMVEMLDNFENTQKHFLGRIDDLVNGQKTLIFEIDRLNRLVPPLGASKRSLLPRAVVKRGPGVSGNKSTNTSNVPKTQETQNLPPIKDFIKGLIADRLALQAEVDYLTRGMRHWFKADAVDSAAIAKSAVDDADRRCASRDTADPETFYTRDNQNVHGQTLEIDCSEDYKDKFVGGGRKHAGNTATTNTSTAATALSNQTGVYSEMLKVLLRAAECERDHYIRSSEESPPLEQARGARLYKHHYHHQRRPPAAVLAEQDLEFETVKQERDELQAVLNKFERHLLEIQGDVRSLQSERDVLLMQLEQTRQSQPTPPSSATDLAPHLRFRAAPQITERLRRTHQLKRGHNQHHQSTTTTTQATAASAKELPLHGDKSSPRSSSASPSPSPPPPPHSKSKSHHQREGGRDTESLEVIGRLKEQLEEARNQEEASKKHTDELQQHVHQLREQVDGMVQVAQQNEESLKSLEEVKAALSQVRAQNSVLTGELMMRKDMHNELARSKQLTDSRLLETGREMQTLNCRLVEMDTELRGTRDELARLQKVAAQLDVEKDALQAALDDRTEDLVALRLDADSKAALLEGKKQYFASVELRLRRVTETAADRDRDVRNLTERLHEFEDSALVLKQSRELSEEKYAKAKDRISSLTNEIHRLKTLLLNADNEKTDLDSNLKDTANQLTNSRRAFDAKLNENKDLLVQYGTLSKEFEALSKRNGQLERTLHDLRQGLEGRESNLKDYLSRVERAELDLLNTQRELTTAEEKCARLNCTSVNAEMMSKKLANECEEVRKELATARDLATDLQLRLDKANLCASDQAIEVRSLKVKLTDLEGRLRGTLEETSHQRESLRRLETLLASSREGELHTQVALKERTEECRKLREDVQTLRQAANVATTEALDLHQQLTAHLKLPTSSKSIVPQSVDTPTASALSGLGAPIVHTAFLTHRQDLLFYKPTTSSSQRLEARKRSSASCTVSNQFLAPPSLINRPTPSPSSRSVSQTGTHRVMPALTPALTVRSSSSFPTEATSSRHSPCGDNIEGLATASIASSSPPAAVRHYHKSSLSLSTSDDAVGSATKAVGQRHSSLSVSEEDPTCAKAGASCSSMPRGNCHIAAVYMNRCNHGCFGVRVPDECDCNSTAATQGIESDSDGEFRDVLTINNPY